MYYTDGCHREVAIAMQRSILFEVLQSCFLVREDSLKSTPFGEYNLN